jgi:hypothetical protein
MRVVEETKCGGLVEVIAEVSLRTYTRLVSISSANVCVSRRGHTGVWTDCVFFRFLAFGIDVA